MSTLVDRSGFDLSGLRFEPDLKFALESDYWEEFGEVNITEVLGPDPGLKVTNGPKRSNKVADGGSAKKPDEDGKYYTEPELPYCFCFCCRTGTPFVVWVFIAISVIFFQMGAIVTGRWISISDSSWDEIVYYAAFSVCLGFSTFYFRHGTKTHHPFDLLFLVLTVPLMWSLLTLTTIFFKQDMFFYVGSVLYTAFSIPYIAVGSFITLKFWKNSKLFLRRAGGVKDLEPICRTAFFGTSYLLFDAQLSLCACIISMAPSVNQKDRYSLLTSVVFAPFLMGATLVWFVFGYFAIRKENRILTWLFTLLSGTQVVLVIALLIKRPTAGKDLFSNFINVAMLVAITVLLFVHFSLLALVWKWIVPNYGKGLRQALKRTSGNSCIQCAQITICR